MRITAAVDTSMYFSRAQGFGNPEGSSRNRTLQMPDTAQKTVVPDVNSYRDTGFEADRTGGFNYNAGIPETPGTGAAVPYEGYTSYIPLMRGLNFRFINPFDLFGGGVTGEPRTSKPDGTEMKTVSGDNKIGVIEKCETCESRKYQDESNDSGVSFQSPAHIARAASASVVTKHEREHQVRERMKAEQNGQKVVSSHVRIHMSQCPECKQMYASGGVTEVLKTKDNSEMLEALRFPSKPNYSTGMEVQKGSLIDMGA